MSSSERPVEKSTLDEAEHPSASATEPANSQARPPSPAPVSPLPPSPRPPTPPTSSESLPTRPRLPSYNTLPLSRSSSRDGDKVDDRNDEERSLGMDEKEQDLSLMDETWKDPLDPIEQLLSEDNPPLPAPRNPSECPIFCCFYAEFDNVVGPTVAFQSPKTFMDQDTGISEEDIHELLKDTFHRVQIETEMKRAERAQDGGDESKGGQSKSPDPKNGSTPDKNVHDDSQELSIFDATSEYIITGNELAGKMINLSTHNMHILTRPTAISDERYERNALLFCVGFILSRTKDPRPFRPLLCKWADALRSMEVENQFLTDKSLRTKLQPMLDRLLVSLNSTKFECNLLLDESNILNLRAFRPPKPPALPVPDHAVPIIVREDLLSVYDWDLAIKWVVLFIDGVNHARLIATKSDVDMEMVRACLRVLKHHGVISLVDIFFYTNHYQFTERATAMLAGKEPTLLDEAFMYTTRLHHRRSNTNSPAGTIDETTDGNVGLTLSSSSRRNSDPPVLSKTEDAMSFPPRRTLLSSSMNRAGPEKARLHTSRREQKRMKLALAELYCSCHRSVSFADLWVSKVTGPKRDAQTPINPDGSMGRGDLLSAADRINFSRHSSGQTDGSFDFRSRTLVSPSGTGAVDPKPKVPHHGIKWKEAFEFFDHRRFASFGVAHGLLQRIHDFPLAVDSKKAGVIPEAPQQRSNARNGEVSLRPKVTKVEVKDTFVNASHIVAMMDGSRCDDELVCEFERPLDELIEVAESTGKTVASIYALAP